jgi:hypothetical protein
VAVFDSKKAKKVDSLAIFHSGPTEVKITPGYLELHVNNVKLIFPM